MISIHTLPCFSSFSKALHLLICVGFLNQVSCLNFNYTLFNPQDEENFIFMGTANLALGSFQVTRDSAMLPLENEIGRVVYKDKFKLWKDGQIASFNTSFVSSIRWPQNESSGGGLAFILAKEKELPSRSFGKWLGIANETTNGLSRIVAIEYDIKKSFEDDMDGNHIGVDVNGVLSIKQFPLGRDGIEPSPEMSDVLVDVRYNGKSKNMTIYVSMLAYPNNNRPQASRHLLIDLSQFLPEHVYIGFSGSTGNHTQTNYVNSWSFTSEEIDGGHNKKFLKILLGVLSPILLFGGLIFCFWWRKKRCGDRIGIQASTDTEWLLKDSTKGPRKFRFKQLKFATSNFDPKNKLGKGGFGTVFKGYLEETDEVVAIKRVSKHSRQGEQEFLAEVMTTGRLNHKNLVKLIGWCHEKDELLLVYEFLPNGSLDKYLFSNQSSKEQIMLSWKKRYQILCGVASALSYLHDGCKKRVLHRDVKASNVMLDSEFNARLGDFGLARSVGQEGDTHHTTNGIAGTPGYIAPECLHTSRTTVESDVYSFGVLTMEVACGQRPRKNRWDQSNNSIIDWVWDLYANRRVLDAVDPQLQGVFDKKQMKEVLMLGLACCHPNPGERPSMRVVFQVLTGEAPSPAPPIEKPPFVWPVRPTSSSHKVEPLSLEVSSSNGGYLSQSVQFSGR